MRVLVRTGDHIREVPEGYELVASSINCAVHGLVKFVDPTASEFSLKNISTLTLQGTLPRLPSLTPLPTPVPSDPSCLLLSMTTSSPSLHPTLIFTPSPSRAGHPEFNATIVNTLIDVREASSVLSQEVGDASREYTGEHDDGNWIARRFLGVLDV